MRRCGDRFDRAVLLGIILTWGAGCALSVQAADKPPASKPVWKTEAKYDLERIGAGADGKVVYARDGRKMTGLNAADGSPKYQRELKGLEEKGFWGHVDDTTYIYSTDTELIGVDIESGQDRWRVAPGKGIKMGVAKAPFIGHPKALVLASENGTTMWDIDPGKLLWSAKEPLSGDLVPNHWADSDQTTGVLLFLPKRTVFVTTDGKEAWSAAEPGNERRGGKDVNRSAVEGFGRLLLVYLDKQVVLLNNVTGEVLSSQTFPSAEAAADVEAFQVGGADGDGPVLVTLGGRAVIVDSKEGKVLAKSPDGSVVGQAAGGVTAGKDDIVMMTAVRGSEKAPNAGMNLYRIDAHSGAITWHATNGAMVDNRQILANVVGERINGPFYLPGAKGVLLATSDKGVRLYDWADGKERWALDEDLPNSYRVMKYWGHNSFSIIRSMMQNRSYIPTNPAPVEGEGVIYVAGKDQVFALDPATGKPKWTSKSKSLGLVSGLSASGSTVIARQGIYRDANDAGEPTTVVTQFLGPTYVEDAEVYIKEDPYGFVGLDAASGKESWSCLDFEPHEPAFEGAMPQDSTICTVVAKAKKEKGCKLSKLGVGGILTAFGADGKVVYVGKGGIAGAAPGSCAAEWNVDGSIKKSEKIYEFYEHGELKSSGYVQNTKPSYLISHYGNEVNVVDVASGKIIVHAGKADVVKVVWAQKMVFAADGNELAAYKIP